MCRLGMWIFGKRAHLGLGIGWYSRTLCVVPCGFDKVCPHHACKDQHHSEEISAELVLCIFLDGEVAFPTIRILKFACMRPAIDEDQLGLRLCCELGYEPSPHYRGTEYIGGDFGMNRLLVRVQSESPFSSHSS